MTASGIEAVVEMLMEALEWLPIPGAVVVAPDGQVAWVPQPLGWG